MKLLIALLGLLAPILLGLAIRSLSPGAGVFALERFLEHPDELVEPAPLAGVHRALSDCAECAACHDLIHGVRSAKCLACHAEIGRRAAFAIGHHGRDLRGECVSCHTDHAERIVDFDPDQFNHQRAAFALEDRHQTVECEQCHRTPDGLHYLGLLFGSCQDCHQDPHQGSLAEHDCATCHAAAGWERLSQGFDHDTDTKFPLDDAHRAAACAACHESLVYGSTPATCAGCHADYALFLEGRIEGQEERWPADPHFGLVTCEQCHPGDDREPSPATHARRCAGCHTERYAELYLNRTAHLAGLAAQVQSEQMTLFLKVGSHNYVEAERRARALAARPRDF